MVSLEEFKKLEICVAEIEEVAPHPNADKLWVLKVRMGDSRKTLVAGVRAFYGEHELRGKRIVVVNNLEPAVIRGVESQGMLLAASDGKDLALVVPDRPVPDGIPVR